MPHPIGNRHSGRETSHHPTQRAPHSKASKAGSSAAASRALDDARFSAEWEEHNPRAGPFSAHKDARSYELARKKLKKAAKRKVAKHGGRRACPFRNEELDGVWDPRDLPLDGGDVEEDDGPLDARPTLLEDVISGHALVQVPNKGPAQGEVTDEVDGYVIITRAPGYCTNDQRPSDCVDEEESWELIRGEHGEEQQGVHLPRWR